LTGPSGRVGAQHLTGPVNDRVGVVLSLLDRIARWSDYFDYAGFRSADAAAPRG
jgi:hypothetical protein